MKAVILGIVITCLVALCCQGKETGRERYPGHYRPPNYSRRHGNDRDTTRMSRQRSKPFNIIRTFREFLTHHPTALVRISKELKLLEDLELINQDNHTEKWACPEAGVRLPCPAQEHDWALSSAWDQLVTHTQTDSEECTTCLDLLDVVRRAICIVSWERIRDFVIDFCEDELGDMIDTVMCEGVITLQGQHIYCVVQEVTSRDFCESLNNCYPEDTRTDRPPVSERTPWAVKKRLIEQGKWKYDQLPRDTASALKHRTTDGDKYIKIAALADIHMQMNHDVGAPVDCNTYVCCDDKNTGEGSARYWGEYTCNLPPHTLQLFMDRVQSANPDFVVYAGDSPPHTMWDETVQSQINCSRNVVNMMSNSFSPNLRVYPNIGNHEMFPTNLFSLRMNETKQMLSSFTDIWHNIAGFDKTANDTFRALAYYTVPVPGQNLSIVSYNTDYNWYVANFYASLNKNTTEDEVLKQWLIDTLQGCEERNEKVVLIGHHPVGGNDGSVRSARWWEPVAVQYGHVIALHISGHTHDNDFKIILDPLTGEGKAINHIVASTTTNTYVNPTMAMYYLHPENYSLAEYESFYLDVKTQQQSIAVPPVIEFSYSARHLYNMLDLSPNSYRDLVIRFLDDEPLFQTFYHNKDSHAQLDIVCDYSCKIRTICGLWFPDRSEEDQCVQVAPPEPSTTPASTTTTSPEVDAASTTTVTFTTILATAFVLLATG